MKFLFVLLILSACHPSDQMPDEIALAILALTSEQTASGAKEDCEGETAEGPDLDAICASFPDPSP